VIKSFSVLQPAQFSAGQGRWQGDGFAVAKVTLATGEVRVVSIDATATVTTLLSSTDAPSVAISGFDANAEWKSFGLPAMGGTGTEFAVTAVLQAKKGTKTVTAKNASALLFSPDGDAWSVVAREGDPISVGGPSFASFTDPVSNTAGDVAFLATLSGTAAGTGKTALFAGLPGSVASVARLGAPAPDATGSTAAGAMWSKFTTFALPTGDGAGVVFLAETQKGDTTAKNKLGLWGVDSTGQLRRLLRTGSAVTNGGPPLTTFTLLNALPGSFGAARSYNAQGSVAVLATFADQTQALLRVDIP
jgi:hypothetical protein